jgi:hypothetical protein
MLFCQQSVSDKQLNEREWRNQLLKAMFMYFGEHSESIYIIMQFARLFFNKKID